MMDTADKEAKQEVCFYLENLSFYDMEAYSSVLDEILFDSYKFLKFLSESYTLDESKAKLLNFLEQDNITFGDYLNVSLDENLNGKDNFLFDVIDNYISYKSRGVGFEESLNEYYENKKNTIKIKRRLKSPRRIRHIRLSEKKSPMQKVLLCRGRSQPM